MRNSKKKTLIWGVAIAAMVAIMALAACTSQQSASSAASSAAASSASSATVSSAAASSAAASSAAASSAAASSAAASSAAASSAAASSAASSASVSSAEAKPDVSKVKKDEFGVVKAEEWADIYPNQYNTYLANAKNVPGYKGEYAEITASEPDTTSAGDIKATASDGKANFLETNPEIKVLGKGYGYAKYYTEPGGHTYSIWSIEHNGRLGDVRGGKTGGILACYACKNPQIHFDAEAKGGHEAWYLGAVTETAAANGVELKMTDAGKEVIGWRQSAANGANYYTENISCANCHVNEDPGAGMQAIRQDWIRAMGSDIDGKTVPMKSIVCGQCHCDYSMALSTTDPEYSNGEPTSPYEGGLDSMDPEKALQFYDDHGFVDWTYASTGAKMLSIRHAEFEFYYAMGDRPNMQILGYDCTDCHMTKTTDANGEEYTIHTWTSPLENKELIEKDCSKCHKDLVSEVKAIQADIDGRTTELGQRAANFIQNFESKVAKESDDGLKFDQETATANGLSEDDVAKLQDLQRRACYYWNLAAAENSEGAHNPDLYNDLLKKGNELLDEADKILGMESSAANFVAP